MPNYLSPGVYIEELEAGSRPIEGVGTAVAAFVGVTATGPTNQPTLVSNWGQYVATFGDFVPGAYTPLSVYSYFNNGGGACYVVRVGAPDNSGNGQAPVAAADLVSATKPGVAAYRVKSLEAGSAGDGVTVEVVRDPVPEGQDAESETFSLIVRRGPQELERWENLTTKRGKQNARTLVNERSAVINLEEIGSATGAERVPAPGSVELTGGGALVPAGNIESTDEVVGSAADRSGLGGLEAIEGITMVLAPDIMAAYKQEAISLEGVQVIQQAIIDHCENMGDRMAILDPPPGLNAQEVKEWRNEKAGYSSKFATLYWPWVKMFDPGTGEVDFVPPSGAVAGMWGRNDDTRGVHKAPANEVLRGVVDVQLNVTRPEHDQLNPEGINVIRSFAGRGVRVWGARTLDGSDSEWRYVNVRRLFNYMESSILNGTQWVVFEPNDLDLWQRITRTIRGFLLGLWRDGALFGATPDDAFYVKCDAETNPPDSIDAGQVIVEIGVAPVKPAEFVVFRLAQLSSGGANVTE
ncbi:MAG: phage tail sheath subtilisin-like domain-containing protein [Actinomycetota bacterium]